MNGQPNYFKIGIFILSAFLLVAAALIFLGADRMFRPRIYLETYVDGTVQGIDVGSPSNFAAFRSAASPASISSSTNTVPSR
ncbi:MAG: hypothetical protein RIR25_1018, partial [Verrucomicrobiota bacterium]